MSDSNISIVLKNLGVRSLDALELVLIARKSDESQRKAAVEYMKAYQEQNGYLDSNEKWKQFYTGVKKRLTV